MRINTLCNSEKDCQKSRHSRLVPRHGAGMTALAVTFGLLISNWVIIKIYRRHSSIVIKRRKRFPPDPRYGARSGGMQPACSFAGFAQQPAQPWWPTPKQAPLAGTETVVWERTSNVKGNIPRADL
jgi:hypothetical protein